MGKGKGTRGMKDAYIGIDYGMGTTNRDLKTGIHYGIINQNEVLQAWADSSEAIYPEPEDCETCNGTGSELDDYGNETNEICRMCDDGKIIDEMSEAIGFEYSNDGYRAFCGEDGDIFITKSPYYTLCAYCSPCAPGAGYLMSPRPNGGIRVYCFGHDWFEDTESKQAPYPVYRVKDGSEVKE
jgi:hypothetical protein